MRTSKFTEDQIAFALRQTATGTRLAKVCRKLGIAAHTPYRWKKKYGGLALSKLRRLKKVEEENQKLKQLVADLSPDPRISI